MAVLQRVALYPNERYDTPDARAMEAFAQNDWRFFLSGVISQKSYVLSGFEITNYTNVFIVPGIRLRQNNAVIMHPEATTQAAGFYVAAGSEPDAQLQLSPNATNFVEIDFGSSSGTPDTRAFWDMGADGGKGAEFTDEVDTVINLELNITTNAAGFSAGKIPLYKIVTDGNGVAREVTDCRPLFFRLGTGGSTPNPDYQFDWPEFSPDASHAQFETPIKSTAATPSNAPFQGGDKNIKSLKEWMDAVMTSLMKYKGSSYWYSPTVSVPEMYQNSSMTILVGGIWRHEEQLGHLTLESGSTLYRLGRENNCTLSPFLSLDLNANRAMFIILPDNAEINYRMGQNATTPVVPKIINEVTNKTIKVSGDGNYITSGGNLMVRNQKFNYESCAYDATTGNTTFFVVTPDPSGLAKVGDHAYQSENSVNGYYHYCQPSEVPGMTGSVSEGVERTKWLVFFDGVKMHTPDSNLEQGEQIQVGNNTSQGILDYIGSTGDADSTPVYNVGSIANGINLTNAIKEAFKIIEQPIYDEIILDTEGNGWPAGTIFTLPVNTRARPISADVDSVGEDTLTIVSASKFKESNYHFTIGDYSFSYASYDITTKTFSGVSPVGITGTSSRPLSSVLPGEKISQLNSFGQYTRFSGELQVYENGVLWRPGRYEVDNTGDYKELSNSTIMTLRDIPVGSNIRFRISSIGGAGAAAGGGTTGTTLQIAYGNGRSITTSPNSPIEIAGPGGEIPFKIHDDAQISGRTITSAVQSIPLAANPMSTGMVGLWVDETTMRLQYTRPDGTILKVGDILETVGGNNSQMSRFMVNASDSTIPAGSPVYIVGPGQVALAHCDSEVSAKFLGISATSIPAGNQGRIIYAGVVPGIFYGMGLNNGYIWLGSAPGQLSLVEPQNVGDYLVIIGLIDGEDLILQPQMNGQL